MLIADIWNDAKSSRGYGICKSDELYAAITEAVATLSNKGSWDWMVGHMTLCAHDGYVTMPREVEKILAANADGYPTWARDKWFQHHVNGPGNYTQIDAYKAFHDEVGIVSTFKCVPEPAVLLGVPESSDDNGKALLVYGYDWLDKQLHHIDPSTGKQTLGIRVPISTEDVPGHLDDIVVKKIDRVVKPETVSSVSLWAFPQCGGDGVEPTLIGFYYPDETKPEYRRYRFPKGSCVDIKYRRKNLTFKTQNDFIPFDSKTALMLMLKAIRAWSNGEIEEGNIFEAKAIDLLTAEETAKKAKNSIGPQVRNFSTNTNERLRGRMSRGLNSCSNC